MSDFPPLRDYSGSLAVAMGTWDYAYLDPVPAAGHSLRRLERLLTGPLCGWPRDRVLSLPNVPGPGDVPDLLITAFEAVTDVALFYFVGHGQISLDDQLCLGLAQSRIEASRRAATSLRFADVRQAMQDSPAAVKIVILDCCFAGLATRPGLAGDVLDLTAGTGAYTMAATSAYTTAWYQDEPGLAEPQTYFTKYLADLVEHGIPGQPAQLQVDALFRQLRDNLAADRRPVPQRRAVNDARRFVIAHNAAWPTARRDPGQELAGLARQLAQAAISEANADTRVGSVKAKAVHVLDASADQGPPDAAEPARPFRPLSRWPRIAATVALVTAAAVITAVSVKVDLLRGGSPAACPSSSQPGFQQVTRLKGTAGTDLIVCPVQVDHGQNSGLNLSLSGTILGGPPGGQLLMVAFQPDPNSCATDGTKGSGGYYLAGRLHLTASGGWRVTSPDHYSAARSIQWHIYLLLGSQAALHSFAQAQDAYGEAHDGDVGQWGGKPTLDGFRQLARFTITPVRPINRYCSR